jgi:hypothetical protein
VKAAPAEHKTGGIMNIHVYDTYVKAKDGRTMHFDVFTAERDNDKAVEYAKQWLSTVGETGTKVSSEECRFCHIQAAPPEAENQIKSQGYYIYKMENCP